MRDRVLLTTASALLALAATSCGKPSGLFPVYGKLTYKGEPAEGAVVTFLRDGGGGDASVPTAVVDGRGEFRLESAGLGDGALPGKYSVMIKWAEEGTPADPVAVDPAKKGRRGAEKDARALRLKFGRIAADRLKGRYSQPGKALLTAEVKPQANQIPPLELTD